LLELVRLDGSRARDQIEYIHDTPVYRLRGNLLPLVYLDEQLELAPRRSRGEQPENINIVVLQAEDQQFGLVVESITDTQEIVVKPLSPHLKNICTYAGATIMGDGTVSLILDVVGLAQQSNVIKEHHAQSMHSGGSSLQEKKSDRESLLIVDPGDESRAAIQLSTVARLEEFGSDRVEQSGRSDVVQYRGKIMPLIYLSGHATAGTSGGSKRFTNEWSWVKKACHNGLSFKIESPKLLT
jgi:two-component system chemotaxis sensor kinase CheA